MSTTCPGTGSMTVPRTLRISSNCAISIIEACTRWDGRSPATPTSSLTFQARPWEGGRPRLPSPTLSADRRTAWLMASCRATFSARPGTFTRTSEGTDEAQPRPTRVRTAPRLLEQEVKSARHRSDVVARWCPELLEDVWIDRGGLREEEDATASVVEHHERARRLRKVDQARDVVQKDEDHPSQRWSSCPLRRRRRRQPHQCSRHDAVDPVHSPVGQLARGAASVDSSVPLEIPDGHGCGRHERGAPYGQHGDGPADHERLAELGRRAPAMARCAFASRSHHGESIHCTGSDGAAVATSTSRHSSTLH